MASDSGGRPSSSRGAAAGRGWHTCVRRHPERGVLQRVVREHLETFLAEARQRGGGEGLPRFVERDDVTRSLLSHRGINAARV